MDTQTPAKPGQDFCKLIDVAECEQLIKECVTALTHERTLLRQAEEHPRPLDAETIKLLDLGENVKLNSADLAKARVLYYEAAQDRLWVWYRRLTNEQAGRLGA